MWSGRAFPVAGPACENARSPPPRLTSKSDRAAVLLLLLLRADGRRRRDVVSRSRTALHDTSYSGKH